MSRLPGIEGKTIVVLGAGQGIGEATANNFATNGARVVCVDKDADLASAIAERHNGLALQADVTSRADMERIFQEAYDWSNGSIGGIVDIVGIADVRLISEMDDESWSSQFDLIIRHAFLTVQIAPQYMTDGGALAFVSSMSGTRSVNKQAVYGAAKAALNHFVAGAAVELGSKNIRVNAVAPGFVRTPRLVRALGDKFWNELNEYIPLGKSCEPADIAGPLLFLCSDLAACVNGVVLPVDGGIEKRAHMPDMGLSNKAT